MSAYYYGYGRAHCAQDCRQAGCPRHFLRVVEKHGGIFVEFLNEDGSTQSRVDLPLEQGLMEAVARIICERPSWEEFQRGEWREG